MTRRKIAALIDYFLIASIFVLLGFSNVPDWFWGFEVNIGSLPVQLPSIGIIMILPPVVFKDLLFRHASIGKMITGIRIVTNNGEVPSIKTMIKRGFIMPTLGYANFIRKESTEEFINWELDYLKTKVISKGAVSLR